MKKLLYIMAAMSLFHSCVKDDSSEIFPKDNPDFSRITITSDVEKLGVDFGQEFEFQPTVKQTIEGKELKYIWSANKYNSVGDVEGNKVNLYEGMPLKYTFEEMGDYKLYLEVQNEDNSVFKVWDLSVRAYDMGYFVAGIDDAGNSNIAFGRALLESEVQEGKKIKFVPNLIGEINEEVDLTNFVYLSKSIIDYGKSDAYVHIFTRDKVHAADPNTFKIFYTVNMSPQYPDEYIEQVSINDTHLSTATLFTSKNRFLAYKKTEFGLFQQGLYEGHTFDSGYTNFINTAWENMNNGEAGVDEEKSKIWMYVVNGGMINNTSGIYDDGFPDNTKPNIYEGYNIINVMRMNGDQWMGNPRNFFAIATKKDDPNSVRLVEFTAFSPGGFSNVTVEEYRSETPITYRKGMQIVPNARYNSVYYANENNIYLWYPKNSSPNNRLPVQGTIDVGSGKEVTTMSVSFDMKQLYVGVYDRNSPNALKGSFYIYSAKDIGIVPNLQPIEKYENITTRPVQILYKSNKQDMYYSDDAQFD